MKAKRILDTADFCQSCYIVVEFIIAIFFFFGITSHGDEAECIIVCLICSIVALLLSMAVGYFSIFWIKENDNQTYTYLTLLSEIEIVWSLFWFVIFVIHYITI